MKAMILAAGLGTRLRPLTCDRPKALVEVAGRTLLEITLHRLRSFGICEVMINVHYFADMVLEYLQANHHFGMKIAISREDELLDTGGGLKKAADFFLQGSLGQGSLGEDSSGEPFLLHNVDVLSSIDLRAMVNVHREARALATLAVQQRQSSRHLLFDGNLQLCGRSGAGGANAEIVRPSPKLRELAFTGIHVISPRIFSQMREESIFPIISEYLRLAGEGETILAYQADGSYWRDLGTPESLKQAAEDMKQKVIAQ
jgi:NDP-sugar pyrophosphorylase family protein